MPNLIRLSIVGTSEEPINMFAHQWEQIILKLVPHLKLFRFYVTGSTADVTLTIEEFLEPFRREFWQKRQWYVGIDVVDDTIDHIFTLPCPIRKDSSFRMITNISRDLTTIPLSSIHHDTSLYCSQATNECAPATSPFDILHTCSDDDGGDLLSFIIGKHEESFNEPLELEHVIMVQLSYERPCLCDAKISNSINEDKHFNRQV
ncbi:unnamed protein product [Rotaria sp. Silwood2]|nr:unnamed protein product [Rotaria sp. Silwood2]